MEKVTTVFKCKYTFSVVIFIVGGTEGGVEWLGLNVPIYYFISSLAGSCEEDGRRSNSQGSSLCLKKAEAKSWIPSTKFQGCSKERPETHRNWL